MFLPPGSVVKLTDLFSELCQCTCLQKCNITCIAFFLQHRITGQVTGCKILLLVVLHLVSGFILGLRAVCQLGKLGCFKLASKLKYIADLESIFFCFFQQFFCHSCNRCCFTRPLVQKFVPLNFCFLFTNKNDVPIFPELPPDVTVYNNTNIKISVA